MANITDVCNSLVAKIAATLYPTGTGNPSVAGFGVRVFEGWPNPKSLDKDLVAGVAQVSVYPLNAERNTTRYPRDWQTLSINAATLTAVITGQTITIGGSVNVPQLISAIVNGLAFSYAIQANDTLTTIATSLAALIAVSVPGTTSSGAVITMPASAKIKAARIGVAGTIIRELRRQERQFQITIWANTPQNRDAVANPIEIAFANLDFITLADLSAARVVYLNSPMTDNFQKSKLYRRDLVYTVEYATTETASTTVVTVVQENITNQPDGATAVISSIQINT